MTNRIISNNKELTALVVVGLVTMVLMGYINSVQGLMYEVPANDIIPEYNYIGISKVLDPSKSFEDIDSINLLIENTDIVAVYDNKGSNGNFVFSYMVELKD